MKRWFAMLLAATITLSMAACTKEKQTETTPPTTTTPATVPVTEPTVQPTTEPAINSFVVGNLEFTLEPGMSLRETRFGTYVVTFDSYDAKAEFSADNISYISEDMIDKAVADRYKAYADQRGDNVLAETEFSISFCGFDATGDTYSKHRDGTIVSSHMEFVFTDTWYAYIVLLTVYDTEQARDCGELLGNILSTAKYVGQAHREPIATEPTKPLDNQQHTPPKETKPTEPEGTEPPATTAPKETEPPATTEPPVTTQPPAGPTKGEQNALSTAKIYLRIMPFSYKGLIKQLEYEGFTTTEATYAADNCGADWNEQSLKSAINYIDIMAFSHKGLIKQLEYEGFTKSQATYGADNCGADWYEQAVKCAKNYLDIMSFSRSGLISQLEYEGFTHDQAVYGADQNGL